MKYKRYGVTKPVPNGYAYWRVFDRESTVMANFAVVTIYRKIKGAGTLARRIARILNKQHI